MEPELRTILEYSPDKPPRSKLEPHRELIRELRRKGRTYREVTHLFHERLGLLHPPFLRESPREASQTNAIRASASGSGCGRLAGARTRCCSQGKARRREAKRARFVFRENEPLTLTTNGGKQ